MAQKGDDKQDTGVVGDRGWWHKAFINHPAIQTHWHVTHWTYRLQNTKILTCKNLKMDNSI